MPNPFSNKAQQPSSEEKFVQVTNSELTCEYCFETVTDGIYNPGSKWLLFTCSQGHENIVKGIEL